MVQIILRVERTSDDCVVYFHRRERNVKVVTPPGIWNPSGNSEKWCMKTVVLPYYHHYCFI